MSKAKLFIENIFVYGLGGVIGKIIPLVMVPIVAKLMPNESYFGISDMSQTIISFAADLAVLGMYDAMFRLFFDKEEIDFKKTVCSTTLTFTVFMSFFVFVVMILMRESLAEWFLGNRDLMYVIYLSAMATLVTSTNMIIAAPTRMQNKRKIFLATNTITPLIAYGISIPLLLNGYYIIALPLAGVIAGVTKEVIFGILNHKWFCIKLFDLEILKQLLKIAIPLVPNFVIYWIFNSSDRLMITNLIDVGAEGIYAVGSKLGHASQLIYLAFVGGWQYFAFSTMKDKKQVQTNSLIFEYLGAISFVSASFICAGSFWIYNLLFTGVYVEGFLIAPYLFLAPLLQMLFQVACNQFLIIKKTWPNMLILLGGAIINVVLNFILIPAIGIEGASIATLMGYIISDVIAVVVLCKMKLMSIRPKFILSVIGMLVVFLMWRMITYGNLFWGLCVALFYTLFVLVLYADEMRIIIQRLVKRKGVEEK